MTSPFRLLLVDDHPVVLFGLRLLFRDHPRFALVAEAADAPQARALTEAHRPDFRKGQADNPSLRFVIGSGVRDAALQRKAVEWGWSKTDESHHLHGDAADLWVLNDKGQVVFDPKLQDAAAAAVKKAAQELGVGVRWGGDLRRFKDRPHFELTDTRRA